MTIFFTITKEPKLKKITEIKVKASINLSQTQTKPIQLGITFPICKMQNARATRPGKTHPNKRLGLPLAEDQWALFKEESDNHGQKQT